MASVRGVLIDLGGVVYQGNEALPGAAEAIGRLKGHGFQVRFLTNTTSTPKSAIVARLQSLGVSARAEELFTPAMAARAYIAAHHLDPYFLMRQSLAEDFEGLPQGSNPAVIIADARDGFTYRTLNEAFRRVMAGADLVALASNRMFMDDDGEPSLDVGAFVAALEYAAGRQAVILGKPSADFFRLAVDDMGLKPDDVAMIGDDAEFDVAAARKTGLSGFLVRTGKWRPGAAEAAGLPPEVQFDGLSAVAAHLTGSA